MLVNISVPVSWAELTQEQLRYAYFLLSSQHYDPDQIKALCLIRWGKLPDKVLEAIKPEQLAEFLPMMDWLLTIPQMPVRLNSIQKHDALYDAQLHGLPYQSYILIENQYQGYLHTRDKACINTIASILYDADMDLTTTEAYSVFVWVASVKQLFASRFPNFFVPSAVKNDPAVDVHASLVKSMNMQIRALTKGDITKEKEILAMDVWRALTELDAQAEEYNELKKVYDKHGK